VHRGDDLNIALQQCPQKAHRLIFVGFRVKMNIERPTSNIEWEKMKKQESSFKEIDNEKNNVQRSLYFLGHVVSP
jgi:hypothetical protein